MHTHTATRTEFKIALCKQEDLDLFNKIDVQSHFAKQKSGANNNTGTLYKSKAHRMFFIPV